jgi:succinate dehydrogenase / fumarate reductase, iron-sulfur subunit
VDVLLRVQREHDPTLAFRYACRVNMCGSCALVINGKEALACKTTISQIPYGQDIVLRPLNHFAVIKDLVVNLEPFFQRFVEHLAFFEPKDHGCEPALIPAESRERNRTSSPNGEHFCGRPWWERSVLAHRAFWAPWRWAPPQHRG